MFRLVHVHLKYFDIYSPCFNTTLLKPLQIFIRNAFKKHWLKRMFKIYNRMSWRIDESPLYVLTICLTTVLNAFLKMIWSGLRSVVLKQGLYISKYFKCKCTSRNISVVKMMHGIKLNKFLTRCILGEQ
jgi:hypothetical protein